MRRFLQRLRRLGAARSRPWILMYHRIAAPAIDPWGLAVHPDRFEAHLAMLARRRRVLSVDEIVERLTAGSVPDNAVAITFDDGYADNLAEAQPRLAAHRMPATLFLTAGAIGQRREFWWDELADLRGRRRSVEGRRRVASVAGAADRSPARLSRSVAAAPRGDGRRTRGSSRTAAR
jgi:peptidoglycan/xylan/chitin deacetylase (PgdA/CDA1 family)